MRYCDSVYFFLLITIVSADPTFNHFKVVPENPNLFNVARLVSPRNLFENVASTDLILKDDTEESNGICFAQLEVLYSAISGNDMWALKMVDASSKVPSGILQGNLIDLGMYDECMSIRNDTLKIQGVHCMYTANAALQETPLSLQFSICMPDSCSAEDVIKFVTNAINKIGSNLNVTISSAACAPTDEKLWDTEFIVCFAILLIYISFLIACTACELISDRRGNSGQNSLLNTLSQFSLKKNAAAIFSMEIRKGNLPTLHGIRFISMAWVVLSHEYSLFFSTATVNLSDTFEWVSSWKSLYIFLGFYAVDTFFAVSGFLMTYIFLKQMPKQKTFNVPMYYLHRFLRLTPAVIALMFFIIVFVPKIESGALWNVHSRGTTLEGCREKWWPILLYVQNFVVKENPCAGHLWYLAVDMQLFWISPIILYPLYKKPVIGLLIAVLIMLVGIVTPTLLVTLNDYQPLSFVVHLDQEKMVGMFKNVYIMTYNRAAAWIVGILMGYGLTKSTDKPKKSYMNIGWILTLVGFAFCIYGTKYFTDKDYEYDAVLEALFSALSRPIWGFAICWIVYASFHNYGGPLGSFLSWPVFLPLSRLSYCIYLVHYVTENMQAEGARTPRYFSDYYAWYYFISDFGVAIAVALVFSLLFESPILVMEKMIFSKKEKSKTDSQRDLKSYTTSDESVNK